MSEARDADRVPRKLGPYRPRPMFARSAFGARLLSLRLRHGLTQAELAERIGLPRRAVVDWERDRADPSAAALGRLAGVLRTTMDALWLGVDAPRRLRLEPPCD